MLALNRRRPPENPPIMHIATESRDRSG
jgi:hypothetical protein